MPVQLPPPSPPQTQLQPTTISTTKHTNLFMSITQIRNPLPILPPPLSSSLPHFCCLLPPHTHSLSFRFQVPTPQTFKLNTISLPPTETSSSCSLISTPPRLCWVVVLVTATTALWAGFCVGKKNFEAFAMGTLPLLLSAVWVFFFFFSLALFSPAHGARISPDMAPFSGIALPPTAGIGNAPRTYAPMWLAPFGSITAAEGRPNHHLNKGLILALVLVSSMATLLVITCFCVWIARRDNVQKTNPKGATPDASKRLTLNPILGKLGSLKTNGKKGAVSIVEYSLLETATNHFSDKNLLGEGGFGCVYKACFDANVFAAVKKINCSDSQSEKQFENEIDLMSRIRHPNIVSLLGHCIHGQTRFLVSELMQNESLETQLHGPSHGMALTWHLRMKIALDTARGLEYLHEHCYPPIIHRDLKSSNILLDSNFNAKLSDFGIATMSGGQSNYSVKLCGTVGYVAPEYLLDGKLTEKSDVYAFGVILLELLIGRKPVEKMNSARCQSIVTWAMPQLTDRSKLPTIVDPVIRNKMDLKHLYQVAAVAVLCVQPEPSYRPLITDVLHSLIPLVPINLGGALRISDAASYMDLKSAS